MKIADTQNFIRHLVGHICDKNCHMSMSALYFGKNIYISLGSSLPWPNYELYDMFAKLYVYYNSHKF